MKMIRILYATVLFLLVSSMAIIAEEPFSIAAELLNLDKGTGILSISFSIPSKHYLYTEQIKVEIDGHKELIPDKIPQTTKRYYDKTGKFIAVYENDVTLSYFIKDITEKPVEIEVFYHGCSDTICMLPTSKTFSILPGIGVKPITQNTSETIASTSTPSEEQYNWKKHFRIKGRSSGYLNVEKFTQFLDVTESGQRLKPDRLRNLFDQGNTWLCIILILLGGLALNLTPCVLPMIPINIAIIGAGAASKSKARGFALGTAYGIGMAMVYGLLGLVAVLTSSTFGTLSSSPVFNIIAAAVFAALSLAMFDVISIDLSRFQGKIGASNSGRGKIFSAFFLGAFSAILAGACVAPVLISILLLSADLYAKGNMLGLVFPFLLGLGMALPWPFIGAGLSFLPKPGKWMTHTKHVFGIIIIGFACYYGLLAYKLFTGKSETHIENGWHNSLPDALEKANKELRPVFIDFMSTGCKSCAAMDATTFRNQDVTKRMEDYIKVKFNAGNLKNHLIKSVLEDFAIKGFPTYIILTPIVYATDQTKEKHDSEKNALIHINSDEDFQKYILDSDLPCLVDFYSESCGPCRTLSPVISRLAEKYGQKAIICKADINKIRNRAIKLRILGIPAVLFFENGKEIKRLSGVQKEKIYAEVLDTMIQKQTTTNTDQ